ncbi:uncharacterized protein LOC128566515 [Nycticebus coucang]|uniref:uncharacterized protein LOC128566515 n=1 Tax=Nycticebus coucang TaxID=9470 RepID=UPI00234C4584|nr:uncharacterized protein LOC128566515 [Nycticebus coucang]
MSWWEQRQMETAEPVRNTNSGHRPLLGDSEWTRPSKGLLSHVSLSKAEGQDDLFRCTNAYNCVTTACSIHSGNVPYRFVAIRATGHSNSGQCRDPGTDCAGDGPGEHTPDKSRWDFLRRCRVLEHSKENARSRSPRSWHQTGRSEDALKAKPLESKALALSPQRLPGSGCAQTALERHSPAGRASHAPLCLAPARRRGWRWVPRSAALESLHLPGPTAGGQPVGRSSPQAGCHPGKSVAREPALWSWTWASAPPGSGRAPRDGSGLGFAPGPRFCSLLPRRATNTQRAGGPVASRRKVTRATLRAPLSRAGLGPQPLSWPPGVSLPQQERDERLVTSHQRQRASRLQGINAEHRSAGHPHPAGSFQHTQEIETESHFTTLGRVP